MKNEKKPSREKSGEKRLPINLIKNKKKPGYSGFIVIRLAAPSFDPSHDLRRLPNFAAFFNEHKEIVYQRLITSADPEQLLALEKKAATSEFPPLHSLTSYWRLDARSLTPPVVEELVKALQRFPEVDLAYREQVVLNPVVDTTNDVYAERQDYLEAAEVGIDARWAWTQANGEGAGVGFVDLEDAWFLDHEDVKAKAPNLVFNNINTATGDPDHGTAVLGTVMGVDNKVGIVGVAPAADSVRVVSHYDDATKSSNVAGAITSAIVMMIPGDVLLLEVQSGFLPVETDSGVWDAIRLASASGIIVVEAAGNGDENLDAFPPGAVPFLDRSDTTNFRDSGAIMVGSCASDEPHDRFFGSGVGSASNFGSRIDCFAWGENITTAGYGNLDAGTGDTSAYTDTFGGTSGAAAIIAGAALILQGMYQAGGGRLSPQQMRALLSDQSTGTPQGPNVGGLIGVMPNLRAIIQDRLGLAPDVYLRDAVGDTGVVPSSGYISASPDIFVRQTLAIDPTGAFGEGSGNENSNLSSWVEFGQDNYIYVRMRNRNTVDADNTTASVYWSEPSTLVTPDLWHHIGTTAPVGVPAGDTLVVANPVTWAASDIPAAGHYCFVGVLNHARDVAPLVPSPTDWDGFTAFISNNNNAAWRNFNVIEDLVDPSIQMFMVAGAPDRDRPFDLQILQQLPEKASVVLETPLSLFASLPRNSFLEVERDPNDQVARLSLPHLRSLPLENVMLKKGARYRCRLIIRGLEGKKAGGHSVAIRQIFDEQEVGRITWFFKAPRKAHEAQKKNHYLRSAMTMIFLFCALCAFSWLVWQSL